MGRFFGLGGPTWTGDLGLFIGCGMDELMGAGTKPCELGGKIEIIPRGLDVAETKLNRG